MSETASSRPGRRDDEAMTRTGDDMSRTLQTEDQLRGALGRLAAVDEDIARAYAIAGPPPVRRHEPGFAGLARIVLAQQLSAHAARAIIARLDERLPGLAPGALLDLPEPELQALGVSRPKIRYLRALAADVVEGGLDLDEVGSLDDEAAIAVLTAAKGIGRWTAEIYLLFALGRADVWPVGDLAVRESLRRLKGLDAAPAPAAMTEIAEPWRPLRSAAARFLWHFYRHPGVPTED
jgi:DNA-3-methyladenine glycosylase II